MSIAVLNGITNLPEQITDEHWLEELEKDEGYRSIRQMPAKSAPPDSFEYPSFAEFDLRHPATISGEC